MLERAAVAAIRFYQAAISPLTPAACRFRPSCSDYARQAVERHGVARGAWLALRRVARCHPLGGRGYDPVPPPAHGQRRRAGSSRRERPRRERSAQNRKRRDGQ